MSFSEFAYSETRFRALKRLSEKHAAELMEQAEASTKYRADLYQKMAAMKYGGEEAKELLAWRKNDGAHA